MGRGRERYPGGCHAALVLLSGLLPGLILPPQVMDTMHLTHVWSGQIPLDPTDLGDLGDLVDPKDPK